MESLGASFKEVCAWHPQRTRVVFYPWTNYGREHLLIVVQTHISHAYKPFKVTLESGIVSTSIPRKYEIAFLEVWFERHTHPSYRAHPHSSIYLCQKLQGLNWLYCKLNLWFHSWYLKCNTLSAETFCAHTHTYVYVCVCVFPQV